MRRALVLLALPPALIVSACGGGEDEAPADFTADEVNEMNDAAAMLGNDAMQPGSVSGDAR